MMWKRTFFGLLLALGLLGGRVGWTQVKPNTGTVSPSQFSEQLPFDFQQYHIYLKAKVNGVEGTFILDNGFTVTGLDRDFAQRCGIQMHPDSSIVLADANETEALGQMALAERIQIGQITFQQTRIAIIDTKGLPSCQKVDGFIGSSVINKANWQINFETKQLQLSSRPFGAPGLRCSYQISRSNRHFIEFTYEGVPFWVHIDLGSSGELELNKAAFTPLFAGQPAQMNLGVSSLALFGLSAVDTFYTLPRPFRFGYDKYQILNSPRIELQRDVEYARLGLGYLHQFNLILNSSSQEYILSPNKLMNPKREERDYGVVFYPLEGQHRLVRLSASENVARYGFRLGEVIETVDGVPVQELGDWCAIKTYVRNKANRGEPLRLKIRGRSTECVLQAEYHPEQSIIR